MALGIDAQSRMGGATLASLSIHLLAALSIPALVWTAATNTPETVSFARVLHIQLIPPRPHQAPPRSQAQHRSPTHSINFSHHVALTHVAPTKRAPASQVVASNAPAAPVVGAVQRAGNGSLSSDAAPQPETSPAVRASVGVHQPSGYLPFGAEQPDPVLDPAMVKQLGALGVHVTLTVTVGDDGRTESIAFAPPLDPALEGRIRSLLAEASWDPAVCGGGVTCEGRATIKL